MGYRVPDYCILLLATVTGAHVGRLYTTARAIKRRVLSVLRRLR